MRNDILLSPTLSSRRPRLSRRVVLCHSCRPRERTCTATRACTRLHRHDRSTSMTAAQERAHTCKVARVRSPGCRCTRPEHRAKARISVGCCVLPIAGNSVARLVPRTRRCDCRLGTQVAGCPDQCNEPKIQGKCKPRLPIPSHAHACTYAHAHAGKCDLDFLVCICYCDEGFCCSVCVVPSTHCWPPHSH